MILLAQMPDEGITVLATMATPAVLLLANAMMILSTNQRLQSILDHVRETELTIAGENLAPETADLTLLQEFLVGHAKRARMAHRALLSFYSSAGLFTVVIIGLGIGTLGFGVGLPLALSAAFAGCVLLFVGVVLLMSETWIGIKVTDRRFRTIMELCDQLGLRRSSKTGEQRSST